MRMGAATSWDQVILFAKSHAAGASTSEGEISWQCFSERQLHLRLLSLSVTCQPQSLSDITQPTHSRGWLVCVCVCLSVYVSEWLKVVAMIGAVAPWRLKSSNSQVESCEHQLQIATGNQSTWKREVFHKDIVMKLSISLRTVIYKSLMSACLLTGALQCAFQGLFGWKIQRK